MAVDDYITSTSTTGRIAVSGSATGQLETVGDKDWFAITLSASKNYTFTLDSAVTNGLQDPYLRFYSIGGTTLLAESDDANGLNSQIDVTITASGTYYLEASSGTDPDSPAVGTRMGNYVLSASASEDDYSANASTTGVVTAGGSATGVLEIAGDKDWFAIQLEADKIYGFTLESGATNGLPDPSLSLYRSDGSLVTSNDDSDGLNSLITFIATTAGTYYLGAGSGASGGGTGAYTLNASSPKTDDYLATTSTNGQVAAGGSTSGLLDYAGDSDWFSISLTAGQQYTFTLNTGVTNGLPDPFLGLYSSSGALITSNDDSDGLNASITFTATQTGRYFLGASSGPNYSGLVTGGYTLSVSLPTATGDQILTGGASNDSLTRTSGSGNYTIDGGLGINTVEYAGSTANYTLTRTAIGYSVSDTTGSDGTDIVTNVGTLQFTDGTVKFAADLTSSMPDGSATRSLAQIDDAIGQRMEKFFLAYYGRPADYGGLVYWKDTLATALGNSQLKMASYFGNTGQTEFVNLYGANSSDRDFLTAVYQNLFSHGPDTAGLDYWLSVIGSLGATQDIQRANVVISVLDGANTADAAIVNAKVASMTSISKLIATYDLNNAFGDASNSTAFTVMRNWTQAQVAGTTTPDLVLRAVSEKTIATATVGGNEVQTSVNYTLPDDFANLKLTGTVALTGAGNAAANLIYGNAAASTLTGLAGNDCFVVSALTGQPDSVADFAAGDLIAVDTAAFSGLVSGAQTVQAFGQQTGTAATLVYNQATGTLYYDRDGVGSNALQAILVLAGTPALSADSVWGI